MAFCTNLLRRTLMTSAPKHAIKQVTVIGGGQMGAGIAQVIVTVLPYSEIKITPVQYKWGHHFAHLNTKMQFFENKYAVSLHKSYQNEKRFLKL